MDTKIMKSLHDILSTFGDKYLTGKELNKARIIHDIDRYDEEIIMALLNNDLIKKHYAKQIGEYTIIETNKLIETFEMDDYWMDSYTKYTKKIGLTANGRFLEESTDVVLDFPYKDTVLKAGMSKEDVANEDFVPNEPFFNEVIAAEEIDMLLDKKILVNAKRYTANAIEEAIGLSKEDNLILKGNNLLALHTLKEKYSQKIKLVYLDISTTRMIQ
ncbi:MULTISPECIES: site-specific DNA-methyltransferase [Bacteria]|uniref:DNA methyltransferase n=1 Tax=Enterococcus faecium TaxID=1352 RepID=A0AB37VRD9_ENTFC|nr:MULTISPECIES: site-specific DNA-methyltransferase [Enterococcus]MCD5011841.1 DNA methyltransferase [Enterococcus durans]MCT4341377.1 site-specific DNA-methyltransferase [Enterococcus durans]MDU1850570.1 site-specific DNA-methyltransferase [Enterococcus durans]MZG90858.1 DNA methyltransferase [Enterococcus durans]MZG93618.1 DNA methyltransferase [Enterococcus durans]